MTREEATAMFDTEWWKDKTPEEIARFQLFEERLCCPFDVFHRSLEKALGRPVFTHELGIDSAVEAMKRALTTA